jgi:Na+-driven multidrug efflux pump
MELLSKRPVPLAVLALAVPTIISQLITVVYNMADIFFVGHMGDPAKVAAVSVAMPAFVMLAGIANLFGLVLAFAMLAGMYLFAPQITRCFIDDSQTVAYSRKFLRIICLSARRRA